MTEPPDQSARDRIATDTSMTLFVEAGAGSGKTKALIGRIVALVTSGEAELRSIAAITFTDKAGAELRDRLRTTLQETITDPTTPERVAELCRVAVDQLDAAAIGTLHSFAQRLLSEHPIEAGLPPRVEVLDEVSSGVEFQRRWSAFRDRLFDDAALRRSLLLLFAAGASRTALDALAGAFEQNWDLVDERVPERAPAPPDVRALIEPALAEIDAACADAGWCTEEHDTMVHRLAEFEAFAARLRALPDEVDVVETLGGICAKTPKPSYRVTRVGAKSNWQGRDLGALRDRVRAAGEALVAAHGEVGEACAAQIGVAIRGFTLTSAAERRAEGRLAFHDLLVMARALLRDPDHGPAVRTRLHHRYQRILLDEFQDTDPIQIELAVRLAAAAPGDPEAGTEPWQQVAVAPGHLFVVGDPKQSIYRFRRADIALFLEARQRLGDLGAVVQLTTNFRTVGPVIDWVNHTFDRLMSESPSGDLEVGSQAAYVPLSAVRAAPPVGPAVAVLGREPHDTTTSADAIRSREAHDVAATITRVLEERWDVGDTATPGEKVADGQPARWRAAHLGDITILVPSRTSLPFLQDALDEAGIAYRAESSSLVYATRAVRDLLMVARAIADPTNHLHVVAALRTPLLGCGDDDLARFKVERHGRFAYLDAQPNTVPADDPVRAGLEFLATMHYDQQWMSPSALLDRIARERRAMELGFSEGRPRDLWRRLRFVIEQARAWSEATAGGLRQYLAWVDLQSAEGSRVAESILPETDDDAVRIMTIHAAKGLEFPVTIVSGMSTRPGGRQAAADVVFPHAGGVGYRIGSAVRSREYEGWKPIDEQMALDERVRLLYVACTRARDHLIVSVHRKVNNNDKKKRPPAGRTNAELLIDGMDDRLADLDDAVGPTGAVLPTRLQQVPDPPMPLEEWRAERAAALDRARRPTAVAATALTDEGSHEPSDATADDVEAGLQKRPRDLDLPPWLKGRYGTAVGRAVHGTLQSIDLASGGGLESTLAAQCEAEAVPDRADAVRALVGHALGSAAVREAAGLPHWREVYACVPIGDRLLEGYVDLLYRRADGLVVVDYKTAATDDPDELDRRVAGYRLQGASYALLIAETTDEPVAEVVFVFLTPAGAVERRLTDLESTVADVRRLVAAGAEITVDETDLTS